MGRISPPLDLSKHQVTRLRQEERRFAEEGRHRWADRCRAILMRGQGDTIPVIANRLDRPYRTIQDWLRIWRNTGLRGLEPKTGTRGRKPKLDAHQRLLLAKAIERGPRRAGYRTSVWTSPVVAHYIQERWGVELHPGHVRRLLGELGFSVQYPRRKLALASQEEQERWLHEELPRIKKKQSDGEPSSSSRTK